MAVPPHINSPRAGEDEHISLAIDSCFVVVGICCVLFLELLVEGAGLVFQVYDEFGVLAALIKGKEDDVALVICCDMGVIAWQLEG